MRLFITLVAAVLCILCINVFADPVFPSHIVILSSLISNLLWVFSLLSLSSTFGFALFEFHFRVIKDFASGEIKQVSSLFDCYYKTASLIAASTKGAAIFSGADRSVTEQ
ncbi:Solanesyl diphosphate synthase 2, chloroplastic -like protein [Gossypium arboreum]|uniref:Solanesyl diphosphate synthase 2, chloroplastic-like protein n=1 Tax=Gossypium arboreum TaxID=29729 RepID=A0A0B0Q0A3_GOSAR|nr:Solanesyl diphosphate synthase 2, chloroplastic -like protein [Gossypium arboreum]